MSKPGESQSSLERIREPTMDGALGGAGIELGGEGLSLRDFLANVAVAMQRSGENHASSNDVGHVLKFIDYARENLDNRVAPETTVDSVLGLMTNVLQEGALDDGVRVSSSVDISAYGTMAKVAARVDLMAGVPNPTGEPNSATGELSLNVEFDGLWGEPLRSLLLMYCDYPDGVSHKLTDFGIKTRVAMASGGEYEPPVVQKQNGVWPTELPPILDGLLARAIQLN